MRVPQDDANRAICDFLHYAFLPSRPAAERKAFWYRNLLTDASIPRFKGPDVQGAKKLLEKIVAEQVAKFPGSPIVATVTAGYDARAILGALLNVVERERITCVTFGSPGSKDFDRAGFFTEGLGIEHVLDRTDHAEFSPEASLEGVLPLARGLPKPISHPSFRRRARELMLLPMTNGFLGGTLSWAPSREERPQTFEEAIEQFVEWNRDAAFIPTSLDPAALLPAWYDPKHALPRHAFMPEWLMSFEDQLDLCYRQHQYIRLMGASNFTPAECRQIAAETKAPLSARRILPFADPRWQRSFLRLGRKPRVDQDFYKWFLRTSYPHIFKDLVTPKDPRWRKRRGLTNFDWGAYWQNNAIFRAAAFEIFESLQRRRLWFDPMIAARMADAGEAGANRLIRGLLSLELNIRAGALPEPHSGAFVGWMAERPSARAWLRFRTAIHRLSDKIAA